MAYDSLVSKADYGTNITRRRLHDRNGASSTMATGGLAGTRVGNFLVYYKK